MSYGRVFPVRRDQRFLAAWASDPGKVRAANEDSCFADAGYGLFLVADGMGGEQAGALASETVTTALPQLLGKRLGPPGTPSRSTPSLALRDGILELSARLRHESAGKPGVRGLGSTVVAALVRGTEVHLAHLGDSRAYLYRQGKLRQLTRDHSVLRSLLRQGKLTREEARVHPARSQLSRFVGMEGEANPDVEQLLAEPGDRLLLCSDGLTTMLEDAEIAATLREEGDVEEACRALVRKANAAGGRDNVTAMLVDFANV